MPTMPPRYSPAKALGVLRPRPASREHDERRGSAHSRGYDGKWNKTRLAHLAQSPLCVCCTANGVVKAARVVDHIVPHRGDKRLFWSPRNRQSLCNQCHNVIKARLERKYEAGTVTAADLDLARRLPAFFP